jgi:hypothetical protein
MQQKIPSGDTQDRGSTPTMHKSVGVLDRYKPVQI